MGISKNETRAEYNARMAAYMLKQYYVRKAKALDYLGSKCVDCGVKEQLEFDHIDENNKSFVVTRKLVSASWSKIQEELDKCVLRCQSCHAYHTAFQKLNKFDALGLASRL